MRAAGLSFALSLFAASFTSSAIHAQAITYTCDFNIFVDADGIHKAEDFRLEFAYDVATNDAFFIGNNGVSSVVAVAGSEGITFLERLNSGAVQSTTIDGSGYAAHSRHTIIGTELVPSQYYGNCERR